MKIEFADIVIVGMGAAGSAAAWTFKNSNLKVLCLDQGPHYNVNDYSFNQSDWEIKKLNKFNINPNLRNSKYDYPINNENSPISIANFNGVGGSTLIYSGHYPRFHPSDFKVKTHDKIASNWLFSYNDLEKFYDLNDKIMNVSGLMGDTAYPQIRNMKRPVPLGKAGELISKTLNKLGWHWWPSYAAIKMSKSYHKGQRSTANENYLSKINNPNIKIKSVSRVEKIVQTKKNKIDGVIYFDKFSKKKYIKSSIVILSASAIGTPRILLNSKNKFAKNGIANSSGLVGKNLMLHPWGFVQGRYNKYLGSHYGPEGCCLASHQFYETSKKNNFKRGYSIQVLRGPGPVETYLYLKKFNKINLGKNFFKIFNKYFGKVIPLAIICEDLPSKKNSVELDYKIKDSHGIPGVKINYKLSLNSKRMLSHGLAKGKELLKKSGAKEIIAYGPLSHVGWHAFGTTIMGKSKKNSVVDKNGKSHELKNLFILDSSIFPTSSGVNPASTINSVSLKISTYIRDNFEKITS